MRRSKYRNIRTTVDGIAFDSKREAARWTELRLLERAGQIRNLERQVSYALTVNGVKIGTYRCDFAYEDRKTDCDLMVWFVPVVEDVKGMLTPMYRLKKKLMKALHGVEILETK